MAIRSNGLKIGLTALLAAGLAVALMLLVFPGRGTTAAPAAGPLVRLAADYDFSGEQSTTAEPGSGGSGGEVIYDKIVYPPASANTLYVIFSGQGDQHDFSNTMMTCLVDTVQCGGGKWTTLQNFDDNDYHDNGIHYTWCKAITPGKSFRHVEVKLASSDGEDVYVENMTYYVDAAFTPHGCTDIGGTPEAGPSKPSHGG